MKKAFFIILLFASAFVALLAVEKSILPTPSEPPSRPVVAPLIAQTTPQAQAADAGECASGMEIPCEVQGCGGKQYCIGGKWGECVRNVRICTPGQVSPCNLMACGTGARECSPCGDAWGACQAK